MADYPLTANENLSSGEPWIDPLLISYARGGGVKARRLQSALKRVFLVEHTLLTAAEKTTLTTFYNANRLGSFNFWWADVPATIYVVIFADQSGLDWKRAPEPLRWNLNVKLAEV